MLLEEGDNLFQNHGNVSAVQTESGLFYSLLTIFLSITWQGMGGVE